MFFYTFFLYGGEDYIFLSLKTIDFFHSLGYTLIIKGISNFINLYGQGHVFD